MAGWGGIIASALGGAAIGGMQSQLDDINAQEKEMAERRRQVMLAQLSRETHAANKQYDIAAEIEAIPAKSRAQEAAAAEAAPGIAARKAAEMEALIPVEAKRQQELAKAKAGEVRDVGGAVYHPGEGGKEGWWEVPPAKEPVLTLEQKEKVRAETDAARALAEQRRAEAGLKDAKTAGGGSAVKGTNEEFVEAGKTKDGIPMRRGKISGVTIYTEPGKKEKKGVKAGLVDKMFGGEDTPDVPATNPRTRYFLDSGTEIDRAAYESILAGTGVERKAAAKGGASAQSAPASKPLTEAPPEGTRVRDKSGKLFVIKNGVPVPL